MPRQAFDKATKKAVMERDEFCCRKCWRRNYLNIHHINMVVDGGANEVDNLIVLCEICHAERHQIRNIDFTRWLDTPPFQYLVVLFMNADIDESVSFQDVRRGMHQTFFAMRERNKARGPEDDD